MKRYVVIGAGAVGGSIGARLHQSGHEVVLVARGEHLARMQADGLRFVSPDGDARLTIPAVAGPDDLALSGDTALTEDDVLVLATKSQHTADALGLWSSADVRTSSGPRPAGQVLPLLCAQNGLANEPAALRWFARVAGVCVWLPSGLPEPGTVVAPCAPLTGVLHLGRYPAEYTATGRDGFEPLLDGVAADLIGSRFAAPRPPDVMMWKRRKLISNLGNAFDALFARDAGWEPLLEQAKDEALAVFAAAGWSVTGSREADAARGRSMVPQEIAGQTRSGGSTYQSLARGTDSVETDYLNGEVAALGRLHDVPTPVNAAVQHLAARAVRDRAAARSLPVEALRTVLG